MFCRARYQRNTEKIKMSGNLHPIWTKETLISVFETPPPSVVGELNLRELLRISEHWRNCAQTTETDYDAQNFLYSIMSSVLWPYFSTRLRPADPQDPGENPTSKERPRPTTLH